MNGRPEIAAALLSAGARADVVDESGFTPLHRAVDQRQRDIMQQLLTAGCGLDARNKFGRSALHIAAGRGFGELVHALLVRGADVNSATAVLLTPPPQF
jgi:ankyrin repeat protein